MNEPTTNPTQPKYRWPYLLLGAVLLGILLAVVAVIKEAGRVRGIQSTDPLYQRPAETNRQPSP